MKKLSSAALAMVSCAAVCGLYGPARGDLSVALAPSQDVTLFGSGAAANNTGSGPGMFVGSDGTSPKRGIIEFNVSAIPAGAHITSATLTLTLGMWAGETSQGTGGDQTSRTLRLYDVTRGWNPSLQGTTLGTATFPSSGFAGTGHGYSPDAGDATWNYAMYNTVPWSTPGGDFATVESADAVVSENQNGAYSWSSTQMALDVQGWLDGTLANDGWLLKNDTESATQSFRAFYTEEGAVEQHVAPYAPSLVVTYVMVPEPASLAIWALVVPWMLMDRGRRRMLGRR